MWTTSSLYSRFFWGYLLFSTASAYVLDNHMVAVSRSGQVTSQSDLAPTECAIAYERMVGREAPATPQQIRCDL